MNKQNDVEMTFCTPKYDTSPGCHWMSLVTQEKRILNMNQTENQAINFIILIFFSHLKIYKISKKFTPQKCLKNGCSEMNYENLQPTGEFAVRYITHLHTTPRHPRLLNGVLLGRTCLFG